MSIALTSRSVLSRAQSFALIGYLILVLFLGTTIPTPLYRLYEEKFGFSSGMLTLIFATYIATLIPSLLVFGQLSDRIGRRPVLAFGISVAALAAALFAGARSPTWLFVARGLQGVATGVSAGAATAALLELAPQGSAKKAAFVTSVGNAAGGALGPLLAGLLAEYGPHARVTPFPVYLLLLLPLVAIAWLPETVTKPRRFSLALRLPRIPRRIRREFALASVASFAVWSAAALYLTLAPSYVATLLHVHSLAVSGGVVFLMIGSSAAAQTMARGLDVWRAMGLGLSLLPLGLVAILLAAPFSSLAMLLAGTLLLGAGHGLGFLGSLALINRIAPEEQRAEVAAGFYVVSYVGIALAAAGIGFGAEHFGLFQAVLGLAGFISALVLALLYAMRRSLLRARRQARKAVTPA